MTVDAEAWGWTTLHFDLSETRPTENQFATRFELTRDLINRRHGFPVAIDTDTVGQRWVHVYHNDDITSDLEEQ